MDNKEDLVVVTLRVSRSTVKVIKSLAEKQSKTISEVVGDAVYRSGLEQLVDR